MTLHVSVFASELDNQPQPGEADWPADFTTFTEVSKKEGNPLWSPALYDPGARRANANVRRMSAAVLDIDHAPSLEAVLPIFEDLELVVHTSFSHQDGAPRFRLIFPYAEPVPAAQHRPTWAALAARLPDRRWLDTGCQDEARLYYIPAARPGAPRLAFHWPGNGRLIPSPAPRAATPPGVVVPPPPASGGLFAGINTVRRVRQQEDLSTIEEQCGFMRHARDAAETLPEPEWYGALSIWARCKDGDNLAHVRSQPYPKYTPAETSDKLERAKLVGPMTCARARELNSEACKACPHQITSPVQLGRPATPAPAVVRASLDEAVTRETQAKLTLDLAKNAARAAVKHGTQDAAKEALSAVADAEREYKLAKSDAQDAERRAKNAAQDQDRSESAPAGADPDVWAQLSFDPKGFRPIASRGNIRRILDNDPAFDGMFTFDLFEKKPIYGGKPATTEGDTELNTELEYRYRLPHDSRVTAEVAYYMAKEHAFHPVRDYLSAQTWDGIARVRDLLTVGFNVEHHPEDAAFFEKMATKFLVSCVARVMQPGCDVQAMLVLTGKQGVGKSRGLKALVSPTGRSWFRDTKINIGEKDAVMQMQGAWLYEIAELDSFRKVENTRIKAWVTSAVDHIRPPFGRHVEEWPRETVVVGTTNERRFLTDTTGSRRYMIGRVVDRVDHAWIVANRDQLWAEALTLYQAGTAWHWDEAETTELNQFNEQYQSQHPWEEIVRLGLARIQAKTITPEQVLTGILGKNAGDLHRDDRRQAEEVLRNLGCALAEDQDGYRRVTMYSVPGDLRAVPLVNRVSADTIKAIFRGTAP